MTAARENSAVVLVKVKATGITHSVDFLGEVTGRTRCGWRFLHPNTSLTVSQGGNVTCKRCLQ